MTNAQKNKTNSMNCLLNSERRSKNLKKHSETPKVLWGRWKTFLKSCVNAD